MSALRRPLLLAALVTSACLTLGACGGDDSGSASESGAPATTAAGGAPTSESAGTSAASSGEGVAVETWAGSVCGEIATWLRGINQKGTELGQDVQTIEGDLAKGRDLLVGFMEDAVSLTQTMIKGIEDAGAPAIENGDDLSTDLVAALQPVEDTFSSAVDKAKALPTDDPDAFSQAAQDLGQEITDSQTEFSASFDQLQAKYDDESLNDAFNNVSACTELQSASGG